MKRVITNTEQEIVSIDSLGKDKIYLAFYKDDNKITGIHYLTYEPSGYIFIPLDDPTSGHSGFHLSIKEAIKGLVHGWIAYEFDSWLEAMRYIENNLQFL